MTDLIFLGSKIIVDDYCSHEIKRSLLLGRKAMTKLDSILKSRDITLPAKVYLVKAMVFPVVMYRYESLTIKKPEHWRTDALKRWCWRRVLRVIWTARRSYKWILKETNPEYSLERLMLKVKIQYFVHQMWRADSLGKTLMLDCIEGKRRRGWQSMRYWMVSLTQWTWVCAKSGRWWRTGKPGIYGSHGVRHNLVTEQQQQQHSLQMEGKLARVICVQSLIQSTNLNWISSLCPLFSQL